ncbi:MAG: glycosyltransferase family 2 protein [Candidatus Marinimicrobia bacterium]|nr:glycosyltransferase family 2 protein [Candidatus Neomarinimicrobiota bacterium]
MLLSVIIPAYNEKNTILEILNRIESVPIDKEIIIVDDGSTDGTRELLDQYKNSKNIRVFLHPENKGKGMAIRTAIPHCTGDIIIIQDADLEYDPFDYLKLVEPFKNPLVKVIYGSRFMNPENRHSYFRFYIGGRLLSFITNLLYFQNLTDEPTCYKVFDANFLKSIPLQCEKFEFCPEVTAKVAKKGIKIKEVSINYYPRTLDEGKKITWKDGLQAIWVLFKYRFTN